MAERIVWAAAVRLPEREPAQKLFLSDLLLSDTCSLFAFRRQEGAIIVNEAMQGDREQRLLAFCYEVSQRLTNNYEPGVEYVEDEYTHYVYRLYLFAFAREEWVLALSHVDEMERVETSAPGGHCGSCGDLRRAVWERAGWPR
jgi:hypothetical protein